MAFLNADRVKETSTTTGTGTYDLAGAVSGFRTFVAGIGTGNKCHYVAEMGSDYEFGIGTVTDATPDTLARTVVLGSSNAGAAVNWGAGTKTLFCAPLAIGLRDMLTPRGSLAGLTMSNAAGDTTNDIAVAVGEAASEALTGGAASGEVTMVLASAITKRIDAAWAVGSGNGGINTGAVADNTWYEVHLIRRPDTGVVDVMFTTTANRDTLPANYTQRRRIGWVRRGAATNLQFTQVGDYFTLTTQINDVATTQATTAAQVTLTVPPNAIARFRACLTGNTAVNGITVTVFSEIVEGNVTPADTTGIASIGSGDFAVAGAGHFELRVNASSQIEHDSSTTTGSATFDISTFGWIDSRGRDD